jgi:histidyl-tRNA synthetase
MPSAQPITAARGVRDVLPAERAAWRLVEEAAGRVAGSFGYQEIETPIIERAELIERGVGGESEVVQKEIYRLQSPDEKQQLALRPEATAGVVRAYFQGGLDQGPQPARLYLVGPMFRHDRPQKGRYREFHQFNLEAIGDHSPALDAEVIEIMARWLEAVGISGTALHINTIGDPACRAVYLEKLVAYYRPFQAQLHPDCQRRLLTNPLRLLDCKHEQCQPFKQNAPRIADYVCDECREAFAEVRRLLDAAGLEYELDPYLVRGLDYYTRTVFEFIDPGHGGAQNALGGGGRYDGLAAELGYRDTPGVGFAAGMERVIELMQETGEEVIPAPAAEVLVVPESEGLAVAAAELARICRRARPTAVDYSEERSLKAKMRSAGKLGVRWVAILNAEEAQAHKARLRDMASHEQRELAWEEVAPALAAWDEPAEAPA